VRVRYLWSRGSMHSGVLTHCSGYWLGLH